jgi:hypothetical protein
MKYSVLILLLFFALKVAGQDTPAQNRVYKVKVQFFNEKLDLSTKEAGKFWPIYNDYQSRKNRLSNERKNIIKYFNQNKTNMSENEVNESLNRFIQIEKEITALLETYNNKFKEILSDEKVLQIYITEVEFRNYLLRKLRTGKTEMKPRM